MLSNIIKWIS